jgi:hypothetical protein
MAAVKPNEDAAPVAIFWTILTSFVADIDLTAHAQGPLGQPARSIEFNSTGNLVVTKPNGSNETVAGVAGYELNGQVAKIVASGTTVTKVTVYW